MGVLLDLLLGGPGAPVGVSALGFVLIRAAVVANRRYLVGVPFLFQWLGFCLLALRLTSSWSGSSPRSGPGPTIDAGPALAQYVVVVVAYPLIAPLLARVRPRDPLNVPEAVARHGAARRDHVMMRYRKGDGERSSLFTRRALLLGGAQAVLMSALAGRLYQLQVLETHRFATLAEENRINLRLLPPPRGLIFDRTGQPLADQPQQLPRHGDLRPRPRRGDPGRAARPDPQSRRGRARSACCASCGAAATPSRSWCARISAGRRWRGWSSTRPTCPACSSISARRATIPKAS